MCCCWGGRENRQQCCSVQPIGCGRLSGDGDSRRLWNCSCVIAVMRSFHMGECYPRRRCGALSTAIGAHSDTRVQSCGTTYAPGCRMVRPDGGTCFWRSTSLTVVWGPHHDALTPPQPCVCRDVTVFSSKIHCLVPSCTACSLTSRACGIVGPRLADRSGSCWVSARAQRVSSCSGDHVTSPTY